jgi:regulator of replication initiation timing
VNSGASVKTLADFIEQESREEMLRHQMHVLLEENQDLHAENKKLKEQLDAALNIKP